MPPRASLGRVERTCRPSARRHSGAGEVVIANTLSPMSALRAPGATPKRVLDVVVAATLLVALSPVLVVLAIAVRARLGPPVLFRQARCGMDGRVFEMVKFRSMTEERGPDGELLPDEERLTRFGRWLRSTSLDELPELFNVLKGDMSLVGPRPLPTRYRDRYTPTEARRHDVKPGITGWAQIHGRNDTTWEDRLARDVWYVDNRSFALDVRILTRTLGLVARRQGISATDHATLADLRPAEERGAP